jgi:PTS system nitrogen regulatory IIA component
MKNIPETADFLELAKRKGMASAEFMALTSFLNVYGWETLKQFIEGDRVQSVASDMPAKDRSTTGPYVWPFLRKELIFDYAGAGSKADFLERILYLVAERTEEFDIEPVLAELLKREVVTGSGIGEGVAVPHAYLLELTEMIVAFVRMPSGLDFDALDGQPVNMAILLLGPRSVENLHLRLLARIAKLLSYKNFRNRLRDSSGPEEIISIFREAELGIP